MSGVLTAPSPVPRLPLAQFSVDQYHRMIEAGAFTEHDRLELLDGWVVKKMAKGPAHAFATGAGEELLRARIPAGWYIRNQEPITLSTSEPEPDLVVARGRRGDHRARHPRADELAVVIEVSDTTLDTDRLKGEIYGKAGIPAYWIVDLQGRRVEVHTDPTGLDPSGYARCAVLGENEEIPLLIDGHDHGTIPVAALLP